MKKYLLLFFIVAYVNMCHSPTQQKVQQDTDVKNIVIESKVTKEVISKEKEKIVLVEKLQTNKLTTNKPKKINPPAIVIPTITIPAIVPPVIVVPAVIVPKIKMTKEEYFEKMFGKKHKSKSVKNLIVPLIINKKFAHNIKLSIIDKKHFVHSEDLRKLLFNFLPQKLLTKIFNKENILNESININTLHTYGMDSYFNEEDIAVYISISPNIRIPTKLKFSTATKEMDEEFENILKQKTSKISGVSNFYLRDTFDNNLDSNTIDRKAAVLKNQTFVNYHDYIFNSGFVVNEQKRYGLEEEKSLLYRNLTYVSKDLPRQNKRFSLGDISLRGLDNMGTTNILGISLVKHYDITKRIQQSIRVTEKEIFLLNETQMEVFVNNRLVRTMTLQPGIHLLSDFPLLAGRNNIKIRLSDIFGAVQEIDFNDFYYFELLKEGVSTYAISAGINLNNDAIKGIDYNTSKQIFSANYNAGLSKNITLNNGLQASNDVLAYESQVYYGTNYGLFSAYGIVSKASGFDYGYKYGYAYRNVINKTSINISKDIVDTNYKNIVSNLSSDLSSESLYVQLGTSFSNGAQFTASYSNKEALGVQKNSYTLGYNQRVSPEWNVQVNLIHSQTDSADPSQSAMLTLRYTPEKTRLSFLTTLEQENFNGNNEINTRTSVDLRKDGRFGLDTTLSYENYENSNTKEALRMKYSDSAYTVNVNYSQTHTLADTVNKLGSANIATAIAFVDDNFAITRPVSSSFILVENDKFFNKEPLGIKTYNENNPSSNYVIPVTDYGIKKLSIEDRNLIFGVDLKESSFEIASRYKTGSLVKIEPQFILTAKGYLHDADDKPLAMKVFKIFNVSEDGNKIAIENDSVFFTNTKGKFMISNVNEGNYFIEEINKENPYGFSFSTKDFKLGAGIINLGIIKPIRAPKIEKKIKVIPKHAKASIGLEKALKLLDDKERGLVECHIVLSSEDKKCSPKPNLIDKRLPIPLLVNSDLNLD